MRSVSLLPSFAPVFNGLPVPSPFLFFLPPSFLSPLLTLKSGRPTRRPARPTARPDARLAPDSDAGRAGGTGGPTNFKTETDGEKVNLSSINGAADGCGRGRRWALVYAQDPNLLLIMKYFPFAQCINVPFTRNSQQPLFQKTRYGRNTSVQSVRSSILSAFLLFRSN